MKYLYILIASLFLQQAPAQNVDLELINYYGLGHNSSKQEIIRQLGEPERVYEPNYECGYLSAETQGRAYFNLDYPGVTFTGNEEENYYLSSISFEENPAVVLEYGEYRLSRETDRETLEEIFGREAFQDFQDTNGGIIILREMGEEGIRLEIKDGKLTSYEYWTPC